MTLPNGERFTLKYRDFFDPESRIETQVDAMERLLRANAWVPILWDGQRQYAPAEMFADPARYLNELRSRLLAAA